jgi:phage gp29-like protein
MKEKAAPDKKTMTGQLITDNQLGTFLNFLPNPDSIVAGTLDSYSTYREMRSDPRIKSLLGKLKTAALTYPLHIVQHDSDEKVFDFIDSVALLKSYKTQKRILSALDYGFSVSEVVWADPRNNDGKWRPETVITRKPERFVFGPDWKLYLSGIGGREELNQSYKWLIYQHDPDDENPYGSSVLRCVYWPWMFKKAGYEFWLQATEKFSVKSIIALFKSEESPELTRRRAQELAQMLMGVTSGSAAAAANVDTIHELGMSGSLNDFNTLVTACDTQISYGLTGQSIATSETQGGSLALGEVQADMFLEEAKGIALELQQVLQKVIDWAVELNFGPDVPTPKIEFDVEKKASLAQVITAIGQGVPVSKSALYNQYGLPEPKDNADAFVRSALDAEPAALELSDGAGKKKARGMFR